MNQTTNLSLHNRTKFPVNKPQFIKKAREILQDTSLTGILEIAVIISGEKYIRTLNRRFRHIDRPTDVLSFPLQHFKQGRLTPSTLSAIRQPAKRTHPSPLLLGDVVICYPIAARQARQHGHATEMEIQLLFEHGLKHLLGFHHR